MKKAHIILFFLVLSVAWSQKEIPGLGSTLETTGDERLNGEKVQPIDAKIVQQVRMMKANKEKAFIKKQILNGQPVQSKTFKIANSESKYLQVKELIKSIKQDVKPSEISKLEFAPESNNSLNSNIYKNKNEEK
jgi:hypothetical protein